jgi:methylenetetrahydrofolate reductase (NADPH)
LQEEAFSVWEDWSFLYPPRSAPRELLQSIADDYWLVSVVCHDYKNPAGLSDFLLGA